MEPSFSPKASMNKRLMAPLHYVPSPVHHEVESEIKKLRQTRNNLKAIKPNAIDRICSLFRKMFRFDNRLSTFRKAETKGKEHWRKDTFKACGLFEAWLVSYDQTQTSDLESIN